MSEPVKSLGIITAPGYPEKLIGSIKDGLPELLRYYVDDQYNWKIEFYVDSLTGGTANSEEVLDEVIKFKSKHQWDFTVALTDLPLLKGKKVVIAEALEKECVALISLPGLGAAPLSRRIRDSILQLVNEMAYDSSEEGRAEAEHRLQQKDKKTDKKLKNRNPKKLVGRHGFDRISPIKREAPEENEEHIDVRFKVDSRFGSALRLLTGMVRANRPWAMFPAFMKVIMIAFTTGAYALVFPTLWLLSNEYSVGRLLLLSLVSITAMVAWIIIAHNLWEKKSTTRQTDYMRKLYNTTTALTLLVSVCLYYSLLLIIFSMTVVLFIPMSLLQSEVSPEVGIINYFYIAWTATNISTIVGALGSALENEEVVLSSTYGYRQRQRYESIKEKVEEESDKY
ncbi:hypothetical protein E2R51_14810 [Jeotgalibacillus sp. S-D1]|uniref:hypothetical protein n=1 Tax=Jeotgalibacillus sp. S-D1 TaxID=2552189 RepID=UPI001059290A|nr:hypothetical protein [Jeotgalibacillus sp. S-D1]TDL31065.1 hypothetical protein E2R51_14810 [Jeotgalibacillus sp. S-D1]